MIKQTNRPSFLLYVFLLIGFTSTAERKVSEGHQSAIDLNNKDICSHVQEDPGEQTYKIREIELNGTKLLCCACNPGYKMVSLCL